MSPFLGGNEKGVSRKGEMKKISLSKRWDKGEKLKLKR